MRDDSDIAADDFVIEDVQGNILRGYKRSLVRYMVLRIRDRGAARRFLAAAAEGGQAAVPAITRENHRDNTWGRGGPPKPETCFNIGVTFEGLKALGVPADDLASFPTEFIEGMTRRAMKLGDFGTSAPECWPAPFDRPGDVHIIASIYADDTEHLERVRQQVKAAFDELGYLDGYNLPEGKVYFGYVDNISQPRFEHVYDPDEENVREPIDPLGTALLGHPTSFAGVLYRVPSPDLLGRNGTFNAFRVLSQDCAGFEEYLDAAAATLLTHIELDRLLPSGNVAWVEAMVPDAALRARLHERCDASLRVRLGEQGLEDLQRRDPGYRDRFVALREIVAGQMCGRWRNGVPMELSPDTPFPEPEVSLTNYDYDVASRCPAGSHMRRCNPRGGPIVQRIANYTRRLVRRGMSYGPDFDPLNPDKADRGLLGNFIGANLGAQFEAVMCDWLNLGLQDPDITGANDPLLGANAPETSWFDLVLADGGTIRLRGFPRFVDTKGGAYLFLPSIPAIRYLAGLTA